MPEEKKKVPLYWNTVFDEVLEILPILTKPYLKVNMDELLQESEKSEEEPHFFWPAGEINPDPKRVKKKTQKIPINDFKNMNPKLFK
jgi:hypothetical protein